MNKAKINLIVDSLLFLGIAAIAGIGLLMKYVLVPGYQRWEMYGRNVDLLFWDLDRHDWGAIHYVIGLVFLTMLVLHVVLHWGIIISISRKLIPNRLARRLLAVLLVTSAILLTAFSAFVKPEIQERGRGTGRPHSRAGCGTSPRGDAQTGFYGHDRPHALRCADCPSRTHYRVRQRSTHRSRPTSLPLTESVSRRKRCCPALLH